MHENVLCAKTVDNRIGAHTHYPTNRGLLLASSPPGNVISEGLRPSGSPRSLLPNLTRL